MLDVIDIRDLFERIMEQRWSAQPERTENTMGEDGTAVVVSLPDGRFVRVEVEIFKDDPGPLPPRQMLIDLLNKKHD